MASPLSFVALGAGLLLTTASAFTASATTNVAVYWGQNSAGSQTSLASYCQDSTIDIIPLSFLTAFGTGAYTLNFANMCSGNAISGSTLIECDQIAADIKTCQAAGKKILLSMGGASGAYGFTSASQAVQVANDLWNYFGGGSSTIRPFGTAIVDGFDLDIENGIPGYYPDFIAQMRTLYASQTARQYYISGAPQCVYPDASLYDALFDSWFDFLFIQFYNNWCGIYQYGATSGAFNYNVWDTWAKTVSVNPNVRLYLGVAAATGAANSGTGYVVPSIMIEAAQALQSDYASTFGGIMMWDASQAYANIPTGYSINYAQIAKQALTSTTASVSTSATVQSATSSPISSSTSVAAGNVATLSVSTSLSAASSSSGNVAAGNSVTTSARPVAASTTGATAEPSSASTSVSGCTKWYTVVTGDYCYAIWTANSISSTQFYALNPSLTAATNCLITPGEVLCVSNSGTTQLTGASTTTLQLTSTSTTTTRISGSTSKVVAGRPVYTTAATLANVRPVATTSAASAAVTTVAVTGSTCPISGGTCTEGSYQCNGYGYAQCVWGAWVLRSCPTSTACAGSGSNVYCDFPGAAAVTCAGIAGKTSSKRSLVMEEPELETEVATSMASHRLNATHFLVTLKARAIGIMPITDDWFFSFESQKDILETDRGVLYKDALNGTYTISADPMALHSPTRELVVRLVGAYEKTVSVRCKSWLF